MLDIPNPCTQNWDELQSISDGRFCMHCNKTVIDFTQYTDADLYHFFAKHGTQNVCGRLSAAQLRRKIVLPSQPHSKLYTMFVGLGLVLVFAPISDIAAQVTPPQVQKQIVLTPQEDAVKDGEYYTIKGRVVDFDHNPIVAIQVNLIISKRVPFEYWKTTTNKDGFFTFELSKKYVSKVGLAIMAKQFIPQSFEIDLNNIMEIYTIHLVADTKQENSKSNNTTIGSLTGEYYIPPSQKNKK